VPGFGHAESATDPALVRRIAAWLHSATRDAEPGPANTRQ
jgi:hypothetical protein